MGTSLYDVTVTLKRQGKIVNIFFLNQDTFCYKKIYVWHFYQKMHTELHSGLHYWLYLNLRTWSLMLCKSDVIIICRISAYSGTSESVFKHVKHKKPSWMVSKRKIHYLLEGRIEKSVPRDHHLSSLGKPHDAKQRSSGRISLSYPHTHDRFFYYIPPSYSWQILIICSHSSAYLLWWSLLQTIWTQFRLGSSLIRIQCLLPL